MVTTAQVNELTSVGKEVAEASGYEQPSLPCGNAERTLGFEPVELQGSGPTASEVIIADRGPW